MCPISTPFSFWPEKLKRVRVCADAAGIQTFEARLPNRRHHLFIVEEGKRLKCLDLFTVLWRCSNKFLIRALNVSSSFADTNVLLSSGK